MIIFKENKYEDFMFLDGVCINSLVEIFYEDLVENFFKENSEYLIRKRTYLTVHINKHNVDADKILIIPEVTKIECINFFISYLKYVNPIIQNIEFSAS